MSWLLLLKRWWPYIGLVLALAALFIAKQYDKAQYHKLSAEFSTYRMEVAQSNLKSEKTARDALQAEIDKAAAADRRNQGTIDDLSKRASTAESNAEFARRLLALARKAVPTPAGDPKSSAANQPAASDPAEASGDRQFVEVVGPSAGECRDAINTLIALQAELRPQL